MTSAFVDMTTPQSSLQPEPCSAVNADMNGRRIRVAVIGCGAIAKSLHLPVLAGHEKVDLVALVDRDQHRANELAKGYSVAKVLPDIGLINPDWVDAVVLATPPAHHAQATIELLRRGIHVLVEKPMATNVADAEQMVRVAHETGKILAIGFFRRLFPSIRLMKGLLDSCWLGRPRQFVVEGGGMYSWGAATLGNMIREYAGGGVLIDYGSHLIDLLFALFDQPFHVLEYRDNALGGIEADCQIHLSLTHQGQPVEGMVEVARTRELKNFIRVKCEHGSVEFDLLERHRVRILTGPELIDPFTGKRREYQLDAGWNNENADEPWYATFRVQIDDWLDAIRNGTQPKLSGESALPTCRLIENCYQMAANTIDHSTGMEDRMKCATVLQEPWVSGGLMAASPSRLPFNRILVTGASGFIGGRVTEILRLREGLSVRAMVHNPGSASRLSRLDVELVQGGLEEPVERIDELIRGCDAVVHCAVGTVWGDRRKNIAVTVDGTRRLAEVALRAGVKKFIHLSTITVYGDELLMSGIIDETMPMRPVAGSEYSESKAEAERAVLRLFEQGLPAIILRPARVFGPFSRIFIHRPIQAIAQGRFQWLGNPDAACDMVYVDNVVAAIVAALKVANEGVIGEALNVSDGLTTSWWDFYQWFAEQFELNLENTPRRSYRDSKPAGKLHRMLSWPVGVARGFGSTISSPEFKAFGRRVLENDAIGSLPRWLFERVPAFERGIRRIIKADDSLPLYRREASVQCDMVEMGSGGAVVSIEKARRLLSFVPPISRVDALSLTADWVRYARLV